MNRAVTDGTDSHGTVGNIDTGHSDITDTTGPASSRASLCTNEPTKRTHSPEVPRAASVPQECLWSKKNRTSSEDTSSMAQTVRTFPLRDQSEIKGKLFQMANSVEMRSALMDPSASEVANNR
jgi:hypothetical protein